jgi:hypothetical protein
MDRSERAIQENNVRLARIERYLWHLLRAANRLEIAEMADKATVDRLVAKVRENTDLVQSVKLALEGYALSVSDLTKKLQDAIESGDQVAIAAAGDALEANNAVMIAAIPTVAGAVPENTQPQPQ